MHGNRRYPRRQQQHTPHALSATASETDRLNAWFETKFEEELQRSPLYLTVLGRKDRDNGFEDEALAISKADVDELLCQFDDEELSDKNKLSPDIWLYHHERRLDAHRFRNHSYMIDQMSGVQSFFPTFMISFHKVDDVFNMEAYTARLRRIDRLVEPRYRQHRSHSHRRWQPAPRQGVLRRAPARLHHHTDDRRRRSSARTSNSMTPTDAGRQRYIDEAESKLDFIRTRLPDYFGLLPKGDVVVKRVEAFREQDGAAQHYNAGTADGSRPGVY